MSNKSIRELELIIQRLNSQIESKNEQISELNSFIQKASENTQELICNFRAFCVKVLESELAYGDISSRDLEAMSLNDLLSRAKDMLKQNQEKARGIYDTFKERLTQKNQMIQGLTDQVSQLKFMIDNAEKMFNDTYETPKDEKRTPAYLLDTDTNLDALRPAIAETTIVDENEKVVSLDGAADKDAVKIVSEGKMFVQNLDKINDRMKSIHWRIFKAIVESGESELSIIKETVRKKLLGEGEDITIDKVSRNIRDLVTLMLFTLIKVNTGIRWFYVVNLTETGRKLFTDRYKATPPVTEYKNILRDHGSAEHGYIIKDVAAILNDSDKYRSVSTSRKFNTLILSDGKACIPDIVCTTDNSVEYYEVECGNHHQSDFNDKCNKLKQITQSLFFVAPNREIIEKRLKIQLEQWIKDCGKEQLRLSGVVVYLTSISDLAAQKWTYFYDMKSSEPICITTDVTEEEIDE